MIYLIGGPPRCGKSTLAKRLSQKLRTSWISTDTLESIVSVHASSSDYPKRFPKNILRQRTHQSNDEMYSRYTSKEIMLAYIKQAKACWKAVETLIECELKEENDFIVEGAQLQPELILRLQSKFGKENFKVIFLIKTDATLIVDGARKNIAKSDWFLQKTKNADTHTRIASMIALYGQWFKKQTDKFNMPVVNTQIDFEKQIKRVLKQLL